MGGKMAVDSAAGGLRSSLT